MKYVIEAGYILVLACLSIYSFSQVDLNLTLSSNPFYQSMQQQLTYLGYFNRPVSAALFVILLMLLFIFYIYFLRLAFRNKLTKQIVIRLIGYSIIVLFLAYPAFSHDYFNYLFDARIVTKYGLNPYAFKALDFPDDLWTRFMHWTHRIYPYGPVWLLVTLPFSYLGFERFAPTLFLFKLMFTAFHIGNIYLIYKISKRVGPAAGPTLSRPLVSVIFYALNPLILIESLVSPHNEIAMLFFLLLSIYLWFVKKNVVWGIVSLLLSAGTKFATIVALPFFLFPFKNSHSREGGNPVTAFYLQMKLFLLLLLFPLAYQIYLREPYPWYFTPLIGVGALLVHYRVIQTLLIGTSLAALLRYAPYLYHGDYSEQMIFQQTWLFMGVLSIAFLWMIFSLKRT